MRKKKRIKVLEKRVRYCFDLLVNLSVTVAELQAKVDSKGESLVDLTLNNHAKIVYDIVKG